MSDLTKNFIVEFQDKETRHIYADDFLNTYIATQLKVLREDRGWTQSRVAEESGMKQERISVLEDVNYESWSLKTLKRLAKAFDLRLSVKFETFGSFLRDFDNFSRKSLNRASFENDSAFHSLRLVTSLRSSAAVVRAYQPPFEQLTLGFAETLPRSVYRSAASRRVDDRSVQTSEGTSRLVAKGNVVSIKTRRPLTQQRRIRKPVIHSRRKQIA